jgi:hypothetical protein
LHSCAAVFERFLRRPLKRPAAAAVWAADGRKNIRDFKELHEFASGSGGLQAAEVLAI